MKDLESIVGEAICIGLLKDAKERVVNSVRAFLSDKFMVALLKADGKDEHQAIANLWFTITGERLP